MRNLIAIILIAVFVFAAASSVLAFEIPESLELEPAGILPTNPFYFIKKVGWGIQRFFTFNPVNRANLELEIAEKKLSAIKKMSEGNKNAAAIAKAAESYEDSLERLKNRVETLKDTSKNPEVDKLLDSVVTRSLIHQEIFDGIRKEYQGINEKLRGINGVIDDVIATVPLKDDPEKFSERVKETYNFLEGVELLKPIEAAIKAVEVIDAIKEKVKSEDLRDKLTDIKEDFSEKVATEVKTDSYPGEPMDIFFNYLKKQYQSQEQDIGKDQVRAVLILSEAIIRNLEDNVARAVSRTETPVNDVLIKSKALIEAAQEAFGNGKYFEAWKKIQEAMKISGEIKIPSQEIIAPEPISPITPGPKSDLKNLDAPDFGIPLFYGNSDRDYKIEPVVPQIIEP